MYYEILLDLIQHYGYFAFFFALWLGIVISPIPDEVIVMTCGLMTAIGLLDPIPAFILTYLGIISGLSFGYFLGQRFGALALNRLIQKRKTANYLGKAEETFQQFGHFSLPLSYFLPVVRHLVPYLVGSAKMPYRIYATYSYSTGLLWTLIYFLVGRTFGNNIDQIAQLVTKYGWYTLVFLCIAGLILWRIRRPAK